MHLCRFLYVLYLGGSFRTASAQQNVKKHRRWWPEIGRVERCLAGVSPALPTYLAGGGGLAEGTVSCLLGPCTRPPEPLTTLCGLTRRGSAPSLPLVLWSVWRCVQVLVVFVLRSLSMDVNV